MRYHKKRYTDLNVQYCNQMQIHNIEHLKQSTPSMTCSPLVQILVSIDAFPECLGQTQAHLTLGF